MFRTLLCFGLAAACAGVAAGLQADPITFEGQVVAVAAGDSLLVRRAGEDVRVRLIGVDAPEPGQPFQAEAKSAVMERVLGKAVRIRVMRSEDSGLLVGEVSFPAPASEGKWLCLNEVLLQEGLGWWYHQDGSEVRRFAGAETEARTARRGLWKDPQPVPPWAFRKPEPPVSPNKPEVGETPSGSGRDVPAAGTSGRWVYVTPAGDKYHRSQCPHLKRASAISLDQARARRLKPCSVCRP